MKSKIGRNLFALIAISLVIPSNVNAQSKLQKFLSSVDAALGTPSSHGTSNPARTTPPTVRHASPGIAEQTMTKNQSTPIEVHFEQERTAEHVKMFNEALPVIDRIVGALRCAPTNYSGAYDALYSLIPLEVENIHSGTSDVAAYGTKYHDPNSCMEVT